MIQDIGAGRFRNEYRATARPEAESRILFYRGREVFVKRDGHEVSFLSYRELCEAFPLEGEVPTYLFSIDGIGYFLYRSFGEVTAEETDRRYRGEPDGHPETERKAGRMEKRRALLSQWNAQGLSRRFPDYSWQKIELMRTAVPGEAAFAGVTGLQLYTWYQNHRFCPACARRMVHDARERMVHCEACGYHEYPKICPAVIVGVMHRDRLLLTKYAGRTFKRYALIAGFAEVGETIEETVRREVMEEVGLKIKNLRYYKSQPWSFTDTLLFGFFADVDGDSHISLDENELSEGQWCTREEVPEDDEISLTREMMRVFKENRVPANTM